MAQAKQVWFGMRLTPSQKNKIRKLAKRENTSAKQVILKLVDAALETEPLVVAEDSFLYGVEHLVGSVEGPRDLSTNKKYLERLGK